MSTPPEQPYNQEEEEDTEEIEFGDFEEDDKYVAGEESG